MSTVSTAVSTVATDPVPPLLVPQRSSGGFAVNEDGEGERLAGSVDQITPVSTKRSRDLVRSQGH